MEPINPNSQDLPNASSVPNTPNVPSAQDTQGVPVMSDYQNIADAQNLTNVAQIDTPNLVSAADPADIANPANTRVFTDLQQPTNTQNTVDQQQSMNVNNTGYTVQQAPLTQPIASKPSIFKRWYFWVMLGMTIFGLLSLAFGAYELDTALVAQDKIAELENTIKEKDQLLVRYGIELGYRLDDFGNPIEGSNDNSNTATKYLSINEWGIKLKIPSNLQNISYMYKLDTVTNEEDGKAMIVPSFCATGTLYETEDLPAYAVLGENNSGLGCLSRVPSGKTDANGQPVYSYSVTGPQIISGENEQLTKEASNTAQVVQRMMMDRVLISSK